MLVHVGTGWFFSARRRLGVVGLRTTRFERRDCRSARESGSRGGGCSGSGDGGSVTTEPVVVDLGRGLGLGVGVRPGFRIGTRVRPRNLCPPPLMQRKGGGCLGRHRSRRGLLSYRSGSGRKILRIGRAVSPRLRHCLRLRLRPRCVPRPKTKRIRGFPCNPGSRCCLRPRGRFGRE